VRRTFGDLELANLDEGFTLVELLVVMLIIAVLAALAIPTFLKQREKAWLAQMDASLANAAIAAHSYAAGPGQGNYDGMGLDELKSEGFRETAWVSPVTVNVSADGNRFCVEVAHVKLADPAAEPAHISSTDANPTPGTCPAF
jgi:type IV pilus assembly protein PilA